MTTNHFSSNNIGIQLKTDNISQGKDLLKGNTIVGENKVSMEYEYEHEVVLRHTRKTEKGIISQSKKISIAMLFQGNPIWLLALEPIYVDKIFMVEFHSFSQLAKYLTDKELDFALYNSLVSYLDMPYFIFKSPPKKYNAPYEW